MPTTHADQARAAKQAITDYDAYIDGRVQQERRAEFDAALDEVTKLAERPEGGWKAADDDKLFAAVLRLRTAREALSVSQPAQSAQPCPVPWCDRYGRHLYDDQSSFLAAVAADLGESTATVEHTRCCAHVTLDKPHAAVAAEIDERAGQLGRPCVAVDGRDSLRAFELDTPDDVAELVAAILAAARVAFGNDRAMRLMTNRMRATS